MEPDPTISANRELIERIAADPGARNVRVFGSRARGEARPDSDVDLPVEAGAGTSSWFPAGLILHLEDALGSGWTYRRTGASNPDLRPRIVRDAVPL